VRLKRVKFDRGSIVIRPGTTDYLVARDILLNNRYRFPGDMSGRDEVVGEIHIGMWDVPTPDLDGRISKALEELKVYYEEEPLSHCEFRWTRR